MRSDVLNKNSNQHSVDPDFIQFGQPDGLKLTSVTVTTPVIAVTAAATTTVTITQPAGTILKDLWAIPEGNIVTAGASGDDVDFDLGTSAYGGQLIDEKAILDDGGSAVTWAANAPLRIIANSNGHAANAFLSTSVEDAGVIGGPATSEAIAIAATLYSASERTLHLSLKPLANDLGTAATKVKYIAVFMYL